jgi:hypothetical protein
MQLSWTLKLSILTTHLVIRTACFDFIIRHCQRIVTQLIPWTHIATLCKADDWEWWICRDVGDIGRGLILGITAAHVWGTEENHKKLQSRYCSGRDFNGRPPEYKSEAWGNLPHSSSERHCNRFPISQSLLVILVRVCWKEGKVLGSEEGGTMEVLAAAFMKSSLFRDVTLHRLLNDLPECMHANIFPAHLLYIICRICNKCICTISTRSWMSYAQWRSSYTLFHLGFVLMLVLGFYSGLSGRVRTVYLFNLCSSAV